MSQIQKTYNLTPRTRLEIAQGDLTRERVDAIVNAANQHLEHGGGVARAILLAGGESIQEESRAWVRTHGPVTNEEPAYTRAGELPCRYVIHAVGPIWGEGEEDRKLTAAVQGCLRRADELKLKSVALPAISTGIFGFPKDRAARIYMEAIPEYLEETPHTGLELIRIVLWNEASVEIFLQAAEVLEARE